jgi:hypothetical protein
MADDRHIHHGIDYIEFSAVAGTLLKAPCEAEWEGYSGYFGDPGEER